MSASLRWGVKQSFRGYVERVGGRISHGAGAGWTGAEFDFEPIGYASSEQDGVRAYAGEVLFVAHGSALRLFLAYPRVIGSASLGLDVEVIRSDGARSRSLVATLHPTDEPLDSDGRATYRALLTPRGSAMFDGIYPPDSEVDLVRF